ncbi:hypothetical protein ACWCOW_42010 [Streptomyces sp. NPDC001939]
MGAVVVEEDEVDALGDLREQGEVRSVAVECRGPSGSRFVLRAVESDWTSVEFADIT